MSLVLSPALRAADDKAADAVENVAAAATPVATPAPAEAKAPSDVHFSGMVFGDYYSLAAHHDGRYAGLNGTVLRRLWLTADKDLGSGFSSRLRFEVNSGDFTTASAPLTPFMKDAWVRWAYADKQTATLGLIESGAIGFVEKQWGLRSVEKTPLDLQGWETTRDQGLSLEGECGKLAYTAVYANGDSLNSQGNDNGKKGLVAFSAKLPADLSVFVEGDLKAASTGVASPDPFTYTLQAFLGWKTAPARAGLLYARQAGARPAKGDESVKELVSGYVVAKVWGKASAFARVDHLLWGSLDKSAEAYLDLAKQRSTVAILGLDYAITPALNLQPNVEMAYYQNDAGGPIASQDVIPRLTFYWQF